MQYKDYYQIMGLPRNAGPDEIKRAYRKLARQYHPDVSTEMDAEAKFKALGEAYETLKDPAKRTVYDRLWVSRKTIVIAGYRRTVVRSVRRSSLEADILEAIIPERIVTFFKHCFGQQNLGHQHRNRHKPRVSLVWKVIFAVMCGLSL